jgi:hypothetical protein
MGDKPAQSLTPQLSVRTGEDTGHPVQPASPPVIFDVTALDNLDQVTRLEAQITLGLRKPSRVSPKAIMARRII